MDSFFGKPSLTGGFSFPKMQEMNKALLSLCLAMFLSCSSLTVSAQVAAKELLRQKTEEQIREVLLSSPGLTGVVAVDLTSGEKIAFNADIAFPQASAIKIPILMEVFKQAHQGKFALSDVLTVKQENLVGGTGILKDLMDPAPFSIQNLCLLMIALSDNSATNTLIDLVGMANINASLHAMGLKQTRVQRKMIHSDASGRGEENTASPAEAALILQMLYKGEFINKATSGEILSFLRKIDRGDSRLAAGVPEEVPIAFKPGSLNGVSTEWAIVLLPERPYAVAIMESYKVKGKAENIVERLSEVLYEYFWRSGNATRYGTYVDPKLIK